MSQLLGDAGVSYDLGSSRDYDAIMGTLKGQGIDVYMPLNMYREYPSGLSLGYEGDFYSASDPYGALAALRAHGMKVILNADLLYANGVPTLSSDPLKALLDAGWGDVIYAVENYDEPVHRGISISDFEAVYDRVNALSSTIQVLYVEAPALLGTTYVQHENYAATDAGMNAFLDDVVDYAAYADVVGFDVYPIGYGLTSRDSTPIHIQAISDHVGWLEANLPDKEHIMVLQGFDPSDLFSPAYLNANFTPAQIAATVAPTAQQQQDMLAQVNPVDHPSFSIVAWWGNSFYSSSGNQGFVDQMNEALKYNNTYESPAEPVNDTIIGTSGNDSYHGLAGNDSIDGAGGNDSLYGDDGNDLLIGNAGNDYLDGGNGDDVLTGDAGNDTILGSAGSDIIYGGNGNDVLTGGFGADGFVFDKLPSNTTNHDVITDFDATNDIGIGLDNAVFIRVGADGTLTLAAFWSNTTGNAHDSSDRIIYETDTGNVYYDSDGTGSAAKVLVVTLSHMPTVTHLDFIIL